jgi:hypothetical protein
MSARHRGLRFDESLWDQTRQLLWTSHDFEMIKEVEVFKDGIGGHDGNAWDLDRIGHVGEKAMSGDLEAACVAMPCLKYTSENVPSFAFGGIS